MKIFKIECDWAEIKITKFDKDIDKEEPIYLEVSSGGEKGSTRLMPQDAISLGSYLLDLGHKMMEEKQ